MNLVAQNYLKGELQDLMQTDVRTMFRLSFSDLREKVYDRVIIVDESSRPIYTLWTDVKGESGVFMVRHCDSNCIVLRR